MPAPLRPLPEPLRGRTFSIAQGAAFGLRKEQLRSRSDLASPWRGVRWPAGTEPTLESLCRALMLRLPAEAVYSHATAARLLGLPLPRRLEGEPTLHVTVPPPRRAVAASGVHGHRQAVSDGERMHLRGLPITAPERVWCDLAVQLDLADLVALGDSAARWRGMDALQLALELRPPRGRGTRLLREAISLIDPASESRPESRLRVMVRRAGLPSPRVNVTVRDANGAFIGRVDLCWPEHHVIVEYEGDHHRTDSDQWRKDLRRYSRLQAAGWTVIRATADDLRVPEQFLRTLSTALG